MASWGTGITWRLLRDTFCLITAIHPKVRDVIVEATCAGLRRANHARLSDVAHTKTVALHGLSGRVVNGSTHIPKY